MQKARILSARDAADLIHDDDIVTVSSSSGLGCPDAMLAGIGERFAETGSPQRLTTIHPIAAGDMYGIRGIDHIAREGLLSTVIAGSYPSGPSSAEPPQIWQLIQAEKVNAYNFPSGVIFQMHRSAAVRGPGVFTRVGIDTFIDPRREGGRMNRSSPREHVRVTSIDGEEWLHFPAIVPDVAIIRATTADEYGNLTFEEEGSTLGALDQAYAAHNNGGLVIAQVKRLAQGGTLTPGDVRVPGILIDVIVLAPDQLQTTHTDYDPAISGQLRRPASAIPPLPFTLEKVIARRAAQELRAGQTVNLGFGVSALVPHVLVEEGQSEAISWVLEQGPVGGIPLLDFAFGSSQNPDALMPSIDQFTLLQGGGFDHALLSFLEIGEDGSVNVHYLEQKRHVTAGVGGFADISSSAPSIVFIGSFTAGSRDIGVGPGGLDIRADGPFEKLRPEVSSVTFSGPRALALGQRVRYVTERCVMELTGAGIVVTEVAPGVDLQRDILDRAGFPLRISPDVKGMDAALFTEGLLGLSLLPASEHVRFTEVVAV